MDIIIDFFNHLNLPLLHASETIFFLRTKIRSYCRKLLKNTARIYQSCTFKSRIFYIAYKITNINMLFYETLFALYTNDDIM